MKSNLDLKKLYNISFRSMHKLISSKNFTEDDLLKIISSLNLDDKIMLFHKNNYDFDAISKFLSFYHEELQNSFHKDYIRFQTLFNMYLLIIELFTALSILFSSNKKKRVLINKIFETLKESKNMLKFFIPFEEKELKIINNLIGEHLYYFSHIQYINTKDKSIDHICQEYLLNTEQIKDGYELSLQSDFGDNTYKNKKIEEMIFINNLSFLLLKMIYKIDFYMPKERYFDNNYFIDILNLFKKVSILNKDSILESKNDFEEALLEEFINSSEYLKNKKNYNMWDEKTKLLALNTDEYKQLIDIISSSK